MSKLDERIEVIREQYGLAREDFWELPQRKGTWVAKHSALEIVAVKAGIAFDPPQIIEADTKNSIAVLSVTGSVDGRHEWSTGEASPKNTHNTYPWAMAEKRAKDRVILKLAGIHGLVYSEDELSEPQSAPVKAPANQTATDTPDAIDEALSAAAGSSGDETMSRYKARPIDKEFREELESCPSVEAINAFWSKPEFQAEFAKFPKSYQDMLESYKDGLIEDFEDSAAWSDEIDGKLRACITMDDLRKVWETETHKISRMLSTDADRVEATKDEMKRVLAKGPMPKFEESK